MLKLDKIAEMLRDQRIRQSKKIEAIQEDHRKRIIQFSGESNKSIFFAGGDKRFFRKHEKISLSSSGEIGQG